MKIILPNHNAVDWVALELLGYSETYGTKAINRARLIARAKFRCALAVNPVRRRLYIRACGLMFAFKRVISL